MASQPTDPTDEQDYLTEAVTAVTALRAATDYPLRVLVCGGRDYQDRAKVWDVLDRTRIIGAICHGGARGADTLAGEYAVARGLPCYAYWADWKTFGKRAGVMRNAEMLADFGPDLVVAFPGGRGTAHMVSIAKSAGVEVLIVDASLSAARPDQEHQ